MKTRTVLLRSGWLQLALMFWVMFNGKASEIAKANAKTQKSSKTGLNSAGSLNPELYREGIASLVHAKEQAEEMMFRNDVIAQLVTDLPGSDSQSRMLLTGNHKEMCNTVSDFSDHGNLDLLMAGFDFLKFHNPNMFPENANRSFFEYLKSYKTGNCGHFDVYKLLDMVRKSRHKAMMETTPNQCTTGAGDDVVRANKYMATSGSQLLEPTERVNLSNSTKATGELLQGKFEDSSSSTESSHTEDPLGMFRIPILKSQQDRVSSSFANHRPGADQQNFRNPGMISSFRKKPFTPSKHLNPLNLFGRIPKHQYAGKKHIKQMNHEQKVI